MKDHPVAEPGTTRVHGTFGKLATPFAPSAVGRAALIAGLYFVAAWASGSLLLRPDRVAVFWPPSGVLLAALLLNPPRRWPAILLLILPANGLAAWLNGSPWQIGVGYAVATCAGATSGAWLLRGRSVSPVMLMCVNEVLALLASAALGASLAATLGAGVDELHYGHARYGFSWCAWWVGNILGVLAFAPAGLTWAHGGWSTLKNSPRSRIVEEVVLLAVIVTIILLVCSQPPTLDRFGPIRNLAYPLLILSAMRFGPRGVSTAAAVLATLVVWHTASDLGPFAIQGPDAWRRVFTSQVFLGTVLVAGLLLAASIAERQASRGALRSSEDRHRLIIQNSPYCIGELDLQGRILAVNPAGLNLLGADHEHTVLGKSYLEPVAEFDRHRVEMLFQRARAGEIVEFEFTTVMGREFHATLAPLVDEGRIARIIGLAHDITARKLAESALRENEQWLRLGLDAAGMGVWGWNIETDEISYSDHLGRVYRLQPGEKLLTYDDFLAAVHPEDRQGVDAAVAAAINDDSPYRVDYRVVRPDAAVRWISGAGSVFRNPRGRPVRMVGVSVDITERKQAEQAIRRSEELFRLAIDASRIGVFTQDRDLRFTWVYNPAGKLTPEQLVGRSDAELYPAQEAARLAAIKRPVLEQGASVREEVALTIHGEVRTFDLRVDPLRDSSGAVVGITGAALDITSRRRAEAELERHRHHLKDLVRRRTEELEASQQQLRQSERLASIGTLAAGIAHEINNPVGTTLLSAEIALADGGRDPRNVQRCLESIRDDAQRCGRIVKSVLQFAKQETLEKQPCDANDVVRRSAAAAARRARQRGATVYTRLADSVEPVLLDPTAMEHAVVNLINNAIDASPAGGQVLVSTRCEDHRVVIAVRDDGAGVTPEQKMRLFDPFYTTKQDQGGSGLGLSLAHGIVAEHGGTIRVDSQPGAGATFTIVLPCCALRESALAASDGSNGQPA